MDIIGRSYLLITSGSKRVKRIRWYFKRIQPKINIYHDIFRSMNFLNLDENSVFLFFWFLIPVLLIVVLLRPLVRVIKIITESSKQKKSLLRKLQTFHG